jgi:hypothetical protein
MTSGEAATRAAFLDQETHCRNLGSPFTVRLMRLCAERRDRSGAVGRRVLDWPGSAGPRADAVPLRLAGALHALALTGADAGLASAWPPHDADDPAIRDATYAALRVHEAEILQWLDTPPQTTEVRRSNALYPGLMLVAARTGLPPVRSGQPARGPRRQPR